MRKLDRWTAINLAIGALILLLLIGFGLSQRDDPDPARQTKAGRDQADRCGSQRTYDLIKRELFRRAAQVRGADRAAFDRLSAVAVVRMEAPVLTGRDERLGTIGCSGRLSLDLPPGVAVVGGRRTLQADIKYRLQPASDGSGDVPILEGADAVIVPLATLARDRSTSAPQPPSPAVPAGPGPAPGAGDSAASIEPSQQPRSAATPSFDCRLARTAGEIAVCRDHGLAALDRQMAAQYGRAMASADARRRQWLRATRDSFLHYRDRCGTADCIADAYRGRMSEIDDIMSGRWRPGR